MNFEPTVQGFRIIMTHEKDIDKLPGLYITANHYPDVMLYHRDVIEYDLDEDGEYRSGVTVDTEALYDMLRRHDCRVKTFRLNDPRVAFTIRGEKRLREKLLAQVEALVFPLCGDESYELHIVNGYEFWTYSVQDAIYKYEKHWWPLGYDRYNVYSEATQWIVVS